MTNVCLAPLAGVTDWVFRTLCFENGCDCAFTEMVSAMGYVCSPKGNEALDSLLYRAPNEKKLILQLFGKEPDIIAKAAEELSATGKYDGIDINMGCPVHKVAASGEGSGLMRTPELAEKIMEAAVKVSHVPVSVKMRLGWDDDSKNVLTLAKMAENAGVSFITIHGRTRSQMYSGKADWSMIADVKKQVNIPVFGNGDIFTPEDAVEKQKISGVDGVMIARGAMGNPWIFSQVKDLAEGRKPREISIDEKITMIEKHYNMQLTWRSEYIAVREMRKNIGWYLHGVKGAAKLRDEINRIDKPEKVFLRLSQFRDEVLQEQ